MKKFILPLLLILSISLLIAAESEASDVVGYFKRNIPAGSWEPFSIPFGYDDYEPTNVLGLGFEEDDMVSDLAGGDVYFYLNDIDGMGTPGWVGTAPEILPGKGYWLYRSEGFNNFNFFQVGKVNPSVLNFTFDGYGGWTAFSLNESRNVDPNEMNIVGAIEGDMIQDAAGGDVFFYLNDYDGMGNPGWVGTNPDGILPTVAYWYIGNMEGTYEWTYVPGGATRGGTPQTLKVMKQSRK